MVVRQNFTGIFQNKFRIYSTDFNVSTTARFAQQTVLCESTNQFLEV